MTIQGKPIVCFAGTKETLRGALVVIGKKVAAMRVGLHELNAIDNAMHTGFTLMELERTWLVMNHSQHLLLDAKEDQPGRRALECWRVAVMVCSEAAKEFHAAINDVVECTEKRAGNGCLDSVQTTIPALQYLGAIAQHHAAKQAAGLAAELVEQLKRAAWLVDSLLSVIPEKEGGEAAAISVPQGM